MIRKINLTKGNRIIACAVPNFGPVSMVCPSPLLLPPPSLASAWYYHAWAW